MRNLPQYFYKGYIPLNINFILIIYDYQISVKNTSEQTIGVLALFHIRESS